MNKKWKFLIVLIILSAMWIRFAPMFVWRDQAIEWADRHCTNQEYRLDYNWSWWSLRFTSVNSKCRIYHDTVYYDRETGNWIYENPIWRW